ncbi:substrate-binding domain-containing protein [Dongia sedimenti]|uniref:Substrate-binding domain-containing protein n=1 Tax=Dongia sedimenti TaxID=3064282 RepID=A0ABU0YUL3_9PROT|nr:substrate-binding domain-containing protein [Rhodospirillaceae bacterium R-7]
MTVRAHGIAAALLLGAVAALSSAPVGARADDHPEAVDRSSFRVCSDPSNLPFSNDKGEGFENKIAELFAAKLNVPLKYTWYPNSIGFLRNTLRVRRCDIVMGTVSGAELTQTTNPYYRSVYVMVTRKADNITADKIEDPQLKTLKIGLTAGAPPADIAAKNGLAPNIRPYDLYVDTRYQHPGQDMIDDLANKQIDVALLWGPIAGYYAAQHGDELKVTPLVNEPKSTRMEFYITMAVRPGENQWKNDINKLIRENKAEIDKILHDYHVPTLNARGELIQ